MPHSERNIIITGAMSGIGAAAARAFSESGDRAHLFDLSQERLDDVAAQLKTVKTYHAVFKHMKYQHSGAGNGIDGFLKTL